MFMNGNAAMFGELGDGNLVYPVFGHSKRKLELEENFHHAHPGVPELFNTSAAKRQKTAPPERVSLLAPVGQDMVSLDAMNTLMEQEINHNLPLNSEMSLDTFQRPAPIGMEDEQETAPALFQVAQEGCLPMNINEETYSHIPVEGEAQMAMDYIPDQQQYKTSEMIFPCGENCIGGEHSPTTGRVKCYCRPSWEGLQGMVPYFSDYY